MPMDIPAYVFDFDEATADRLVSRVKKRRVIRTAFVFAFLCLALAVFAAW